MQTEKPDTFISIKIEICKKVDLYPVYVCLLKASTPSLPIKKNSVQLFSFCISITWLTPPPLPTDVYLNRCSLINVSGGLIIL